MAKTCPSCGHPQGSNADCLSCRDAAARDLAEQAKDITPGSLSARAAAGRRFDEAPPWYARFAPKALLKRLRLLWMVIEDYASGRYQKLPWKAVLILAAALAYVISPLDLIPDWLVPIGWTDDMLVLVIAWRAVKKELKVYCQWKGLSPAEFGIAE